MPKISVIVPVYKVEQYLDRCVESILAQTFKDFELILVDDGSPDNCPKMCDEWARKHECVKVIHKQNEGVSMARNDAVKKSESEYITFIDSDDWIYPEYLSMLYSNAIKYSADICTVLVSRDNVPDVSDGTVTVYNGREAIEVYARFDDERFRSSVAKLIRRSFVLNIPFPTDRTYSEDMAIVYQWLFSAEIVVGVDYSLYFYFTNNESVSTQPYGLHRLGDLKTWNEMLAFFKEKGFDELHASKQPQYANALYTQYEQLLAINETEIASKVKRELKRICKNSKLSNYKNQPHIYNCLYPKRMKIYWTLQGILGGFKCRK